MLKKISVIATLLGVSLLSACNEDYAAMPTVDKVDVERYLGKWYEIAVIPNRFQSMCVADTRAEYRKDEGAIRVINRCRKQDGKIETAEGIAKIVDGSNNAKLRVSFFRPFYGNYWILDLDPNYQWVLVGEPSRKYGWVLSRNMKLEPEQWQQAMKTAEKLGYKISDFKQSPQINSIE
ncbi:lipocalin family protein [Undibacterium sp. LX40W]|uniref:Outer membrane lipoprotein Blc n=1 Tax=Undibacterium nitidum TaxID=2762298 RepID=A0A923HS28_9BURK|nr:MULTISPECIES: lipocalin family protein [Undibacterium]MBC3882275.1 lipocalin family protein [Undibacterium nitidum]MBC3892556.1 lipocalin family protein [Undibacterium sp. LX40W]